jgi:hypothetical protein
MDWLEPHRRKSYTTSEGHGSEGYLNGCSSTRGGEGER